MTTFSFTLTLLPLSDGRGLGMPTVYGYARCSTDQDRQDVERQARELRAHGADTVRMEYAHGDSPRKAELERILEEAQPGDSIVVLEVSRLARSTKQLCDVIDTVKEKRLRLEIVGSVTVDCTKGEIDPMTNAFLQMAGVFAELELQMTRARVRSGVANARAKGKRVGRPQLSLADVPQSFLRHYPSYKDGSLSMTELARVCGISRPSAYRYAKLIDGQGISMSQD